MSLAYVIGQDLLLLRVLLEVLFEGAIADKLFLEFEHFLLLHSFTGQMVKD